MTEEQLRTIVSLISGTQAAVVHLCNVLDAKGIATKEELASSFEATAEVFPDPLGAIPLRHIASGIRNSSTPEATAELDRVLARMRPPSPPSAG
ncbi:hypothetical protein [Variovorax sp. W6]|uniref:hypothetical protein n=1 Tax=Variovorax sp. W6 TaxID=3093895 RepID=UPI003D8033C0